jgi:hypothetical protein
VPGVTCSNAHPKNEWEQLKKIPGQRPKEKKTEGEPLQEKTGWERSKEKTGWERREKKTQGCAFTLDAAVVRCDRVSSPGNTPWPAIE